MPAFISRYIRQRDEAAIKMPQRELAEKLRKRHVEHFGETSLAFSVLADAQLNTFGDQRGMITYGRKMGYVFALSDPLASEANSEALMDEFIEAFGDPVIVACTRRTAERAAKRGYLVNALGYDTIIDLRGYDFAGGAKKRIRYSESWLNRRGASVTEALGRDVRASEILSVSEAWRNTRVASREIAFLNRPFSADPNPDVRRFYATTDTGSILGFIEFDPIYQNGQCTGYLASAKRRIPEDTTYLDLAIMAHAIRTFQSEGLASLHLGISPLANTMITDIGPECRWLRSAFGYAYGANWVNARYFNFQGLVEYKGRFRGNRLPLYICLPKHGSNFLRMAGLLILTKIL